MKDNEYSRSDREFFPSGQEISNPGHELNALPREWSGVPTEAGYADREYHQDNAPSGKRRKKRQRLQPAMLAAAAVVTAVVALNPVAAPASAESKYPVQELSAEQRAYLDAVWAAMEASDLDELEVLAQEEMTRDIVVNVIAPYAHRLAEEYEDSSYFQEGTLRSSAKDIVFREGGLSYRVGYDGEALCILPTNQTMVLILTYESALSDSSDLDTRVYFIWNDYSSVRSGGHLRTHKMAEFNFSENHNGTSRSRLQWRDCLYYDDEPAGEWVLIHHDTNNNISNGEISASRIEARLQGKFQSEASYRSDTGVSGTGVSGTGYCLHDGMAVMTYSDERGSTIGTMDIVDGYTVNWSDTISMDEDERNWLHMKDGMSVPYGLFYYSWSASNWQKVSQENPLYHQFNASFYERD